MVKHNNYKTSRKYKCPYCDFRAQRGDLVDHVEKDHQELLPEGYTAARAVYDFINGKNYGICMICKQKVFTWNDKINRYYNLCDKPECRKTVREIALKNHIKVHNKPTLLNDPEQQQKMLANRKISGSYTFTDGGKVTYTGKYEKNALEFMDKVLEIPSRDIQAPGPTLEYDYNGTKHFWITDIYYIPANLLIEIKDGGSNPNNRSMEDYRNKQLAKEEMITNMGTFNYIRLTNNDFLQLLNIFAEMKIEALTWENPKATIHINEEVGGLPKHGPPEAYIIPYGTNRVFDGFAYGDSEDNDIFIPHNEMTVSMSTEIFNKAYSSGPKLYYTGSDIEDKIKLIREYTKRKFPKPSHPGIYAEMLIGKEILTYQDVFCHECFKYYDENREAIVHQLMENAIATGADNYQFRDTNVIEVIGNVMICTSPKGYYAVTPDDFYLSTTYYDTLDELKGVDNEAIKMMNDLYAANHLGKVD